MKMIVMLWLLLLPQLGSAAVFMCTDPGTGKTSFTDRGCSAVATRQEIRVPAVNVNSGSRTGTPQAEGTWVSDRDTRMTGRDYNAAQRSLLQHATASAQPPAGGDDS